MSKTADRSINKIVSKPADRSNNTRAVKPPRAWCIIIDAILNRPQRCFSWRIWFVCKLKWTVQAVLIRFYLEVVGPHFCSIILSHIKRYPTMMTATMLANNLICSTLDDLVELQSQMLCEILLTQYPLYRFVCRLLRRFHVSNNVWFLDGMLIK